MPKPFFHKPVLLNETINYLIKERDGNSEDQEVETSRNAIYIDGTLGGGGHSEKMLEILQERNQLRHSRVIGIDQDVTALNSAQARLGRFTEFTAIEGNFSNLHQLLEKLNVTQISGMLLDLGISSHQIDEASRGFSFQKPAKLDMRMSQSAALSALEVINEYDEATLAEIFWKYGEEKKSRQIAKKIAMRRKEATIDTTEALAELIRSSYPSYEKHEQTKSMARIFQAIRIEVNQELDVLKSVLQAAHDRLEKGGRLVVMSYHSLEDRIVKDFFRDCASEDWGPKDVVLKAPIKQATLKLITKKPIEATEAEVAENPRARSAKLRVAEKI